MTALTKRVSRKTACSLPGTFGPDRNKRLVITLIPGNGADVSDLIELRPERTRRPETIAAVDVYMFALRCRTMKAKRERDAERATARKIAAEDRRLRRAARKDAA